jgi:hypothetical protein
MARGWDIGMLLVSNWRGKLANGQNSYNRFLALFSIGKCYNCTSTLGIAAYKRISIYLDETRLQQMEIKLPLFIVTGASGSGKTYVIKELRRMMPDFDIFDPDNLVEFIGHDWEKMRNIWLRVARNIAQSGRMTIICGTMMPWDIENCADFPFFKHVYYLNLHCDEQTREKRLRERNWSEEEIQNHKNFAKRLLEIADEVYNPPMPTIDTTDTDITEVASQIKEWVLQYV